MDNSYTPVQRPMAGSISTNTSTAAGEEYFNAPILGSSTCGVFVE